MFLSQPDGTYRFEPLPRIAQISPLQGLVAGDFDGDGHADIYAVQNSYAPIPLGRPLRRRPEPAAARRRPRASSRRCRRPRAAWSCPATPRRSRSLDLDQDGWPDFLVTRNNDTTLAFRNGGVAGHRPLRVRAAAGPPATRRPSARGSPSSSPTATSQTSEVYAGSGYYSQSTPACFFGYPDSNPPRRIHVRWPSGLDSESDYKPPSATLTVAFPAGTEKR